MARKVGKSVSDRERTEGRPQADWEAPGADAGDARSEEAVRGLVCEALYQRGFRLILRRVFRTLSRYGAQARNAHFHIEVQRDGSHRPARSRRYTFYRGTAA